MTQNRVEVGNLQDLLSRIGAGLDQFLKFEYPDTQANGESWKASLDRLNQRLHRQLLRENEFMPSTTRINGQLALRPCFLGERSDRPQVEGLLQAVLRIGDALENEQA